MSYRLKFLVPAEKEWRKLDANTCTQFKKELVERLEVPRIQSAKLHGSKDLCKIKLRGSGYRLVYEVRDAEIVVLVIAVGKRERSEVYKAADIR